jgi:hypothetical protein
MFDSMRERAAEGVRVAKSMRRAGGVFQWVFGWVLLDKEM